MRTLLVLSSILVLSPSVYAATNACPFSGQSYAGTPAQQAACLLRHVAPGGVVGSAPAVLPQFLAANVGKATGISSARMEAYLHAQGISDSEIGGSPSDKLSSTASGTRATYFVIHDTSDDIGAHPFPPTINTPSWPLNQLGNRSVSMTHVMINRMGASRTGHNYSETTGATKFEIHNPNVHGLFIHNELVEPRNQCNGFHFGACGPTPGFPDAQLKRLAVLYVTASVRKGTWMIPAFHCVIDQGIPDGHDDPQNFDLAHWDGIVAQVYQAVSQQ
jgi:hypothetical protein